MIKTSFDYPPVPSRDYDWSAIDDSTYDGAPDAGKQIRGFGPSEFKAVVAFYEDWEGWRDAPVVIHRQMFLEDLYGG